MASENSVAESWQYGYQHIGPHDTRHEAIGEAVVEERDLPLIEHEALVDRVYAIESEKVCNAAFMEHSRTHPDATCCHWCGVEIDGERRGRQWG